MLPAPVAEPGACDGRSAGVGSAPAAPAAPAAAHHGHIDEAVEATDGHGGLGASLGEGEKASARSSAQDDRCATAEGGVSAMQRLQCAHDLGPQLAWLCGGLAPGRTCAGLCAPCRRTVVVRAPSSVPLRDSPSTELVLALFTGSYLTSAASTTALIVWVVRDLQGPSSR
jgi:hypothetical protein